MPRPRPPHLQRQVTQHGRIVWYVRIGKGRRTRIKAEFGTPEFDAEYRVALAGNPRPAKGAPTTGTLAWLIERYRETTNWRDLSLATRRQRENIFKQVIATAGQDRLIHFTTATIEKGRDRRAATPFQARHFLQAMRGLFRWAHKAKHVRHDPTFGVDDLARPKSEGFPAWTEDNVTAYEKRWPIGTRQRVWLDMLLYTGLRRGDVCRLGKQHVRNGTATLTTEKTGTVVSLPILPVLQATLDAGPCGDLAFIVGARGMPLVKEAFGNTFAEAAREAGVKKSCHGLRKIAATRCAENEATLPQMNAIFGWTGSAMALKYIEAANRRRLAAQAMDKLNDSGTSIPSPEGKVRAAEPKAS